MGFSLESTTSIDELRKRWERAIAAVLVALREDADMSQEQVAAKMGVHRNVLARIERGERALKLRDLPLFARAVGQTPGEVFELITAWTKIGRRKSV